MTKTLDRRRQAPAPPAPVRPARRSPRRESRRIAYLLLAPALLAYTVFVALPWLHTMWLSLYDWDGIGVGTWAGLANYRQVLTDPDLYGAIEHSLGFVLFYSVLPIVIALVLAAVLGGRTGAGGSAARAVLFLPQVVPLVAGGIAWRWMYAQDGVVNQILSAVGLGGVTRAWLGDFTWAFPAVGLVGTWVMLGLCLVFFLTGIAKIDPALFEACRIDGAGPVRTFFAVTLPTLRNEIVVATVVTVIAALSSFDVVYATTGGGPGDSSIVPAVLIYRLAFTDGQVGLACALAVVLSVLISVIVLALGRLSKEDS
ncbi:carbohydrate ABC transporter permease [Streptomyces sp. NPDC048282]|uniref:carbohydrate ABC transporter permease n=1 Tax=Streptomyces sp. NPDC048282 TaxID=3365528 RepID=UPI00371F4FC8